MVDLNVLKPSKKIRVSEETPEELVDIILDTFATEEWEGMEALEYELAMLNQLIKISKLPEEYLSDEALLMSLGEEALDAKKIGKGIITGLKTVGSSLHAFSVWAYTKIKDKTVSEKYIRNKFAKLENKLKNLQESRAYCKQAPDFKRMQERMVGLHQICTYMFTLAKNGAKVDADLYQRISAKSLGCINSSTNSNGGHQLSWCAPEVSDFELTKSDWAKTENINRLRDLTIRAKYDALESLAESAKTMAKKCEELANQDDVNDSGMGYGEPTDYEAVANTYNAAYEISKLVKQLNSIINQEVNALVINYLSRITNFKTI